MQDKNAFYIPRLDVLRFVAFLLIFIHHVDVPDAAVLNQLKRIGWIGVDVFFCLSAFLFSRLLQKEIQVVGTVKLKAFFLRRLLRIWPLYFAFVISVLLFLAFVFDEYHISFWRAFGLLTYTDNFFAATQGFNPILFTGHLWTIAYEEQFYLVLPFLIPFLARLSPRARIKFFFSIFVLGWIIRAIFIYHKIEHPAIYVLPFTHFEPVLLGLMLGFLPAISIKKWQIHLAAGLSLLVILILPSSDKTSWHLMVLYPAVAMFSGSLILLSSDDSSMRNLFGRWLAHLGKISFGLYVFHSFTIYLTGYLFKGSMPVLQIIVALIVTIAFAEISYFLFERRFLLLKRKFTIISNKPV